MRTRLILSAMGLIMLTATLLFQFSSCSKTANGNMTKDQADLLDTNNKAASSIDQKDYKESDSDLTTVDYKEFYDQLAPHGQWIQVKAEVLGMKPKTTASTNTGKNSFSVSSLLGFKTAYALADADMGMVFVWSPSPDLDVTIAAGETPEYRPYSHGQWENTDAGWYFRASTPYEETTSHYGRWVDSPDQGWLWVPGRVWSPAWVNWRQNDDYVSWAPLPPSDYLDDGSMDDPQISDDDYMICHRNHFLEPDVYQYCDPYNDDGDRILVSGFSFTVGVVLVDNVVIDRGPDVNNIYGIYGRNVDMINIHHVREFGDVRYSDRDYNVYSPDFRRYRNRDREGFKREEPKNFKNYSDMNVRKPREIPNRRENTGTLSGQKNNSIVNGDQNMGRVKGNQNTGKIKGDQNTGNVKGNQNTGRVKNNQNTGKVKGNQNTGKVKGNQNTGKVKGNQNTGKVKGNQNTGKVKGNQNTGRVKGNQNTGKVKGNQNTGTVKGNQNTGRVKGNQNTGTTKGNQNTGRVKGNTNTGNKPNGNNNKKKK